MKIAFSNQNGISAERLAQMCDGTVHNNQCGEILVRGLCTDSREADANTAFVAMKGERVDGHDYIAAAVQNGCRCVICERVALESDVAFIVVENSEQSLLNMAKCHRASLSLPCVAVTGSVGKTTAKEMISEVLATSKKVYRSKGNYNSVIGMPLSVMEIGTDADVAVLELGMSARGEIERMSTAAAPQIAVITNIGTSHMEMLGSRANICRAKIEILTGLCDGGTLILNGDEPLLRGVGGKRYQTLYASLEDRNADLFADRICVDADCTTFDVVYRGSVYPDMKLNLAGRHNVYAALYAFGVGMLMGVSPEHIREGLLHFSADGMRQNRYSLGEITVIEDCYNASPESMIAAIDVLHAIVKQKNGRAVAVLGDMLELGPESPDLHKKVGAYVREKQITTLLTVGTGGLSIADGARRAGMAREQIVSIIDRDDTEKIGAALIDLIQKGDTVLFKASRSVRLERVISYLREHLSNIKE